MGQSCVFYVYEYDSPSGYWCRWETDGTKEAVECPDSGKQSPFFRLTVTSGNHLSVECNELKDGEESPTKHRYLVPTDPAGFERFCKAAEAAGQVVYDRLLGYKRGPRFRGGPYDYTNDFAGSFLEPFLEEGP